MGQAGFKIDRTITLYANTKHLVQASVICHKKRIKIQPDWDQITPIDSL